ncbi:hypothetical protein AB0N05_08780 [Nocardia sp. NPDC051030]|uniref:hypothetical protein n=1 Tax=Nocardia sp. NPDC051030 TaxID=3155162 RepID=UPI00343DBD95
MTSREPALRTRTTSTGTRNEQGRTRTFGTPDLFVWAPVLALIQATVITLIIFGSIGLPLGLMAVAVVLVGLDSWINR